MNKGPGVAKQVQMHNMKLERTIRSICLSMMICCLLIGGGLDMAVICYAEGGHAAIEAATGNDCVKAAAGSDCVKSPAGSDCAKSAPGHCDEACPPSAENEFSSTDDCGDCLDVPLSISPAVVVKKPYKINAAPATWTAVALKTDIAADSSLSLLLPELVPPPPYFAPLKSIVLLI